jgi:tetratricopeptide (TPR) repeat protein
MQEFNSDRSEFEVDYLTCASRLLESLHGEAYAQIAEELALQYVETDRLEHAVELAEQFPDAYARDSVLAAIAVKAVASGQEDYATELLETIEDPIIYNRTLEEMSIEFARREKFDTALSLTDQLSNNASALGSIATIYWQRGLKDEALDLARSIEAQESATILAQFAKLCDQKDECSNLLVEAQQVAEEIDSVELKVAALLTIASAFEEQGDREHSLEILNRVFEVCEDYESADAMGLAAYFPRDQALLQIVEALLRLQDVSKATEVTEAIEDRFLFARANLGLAIAQGRSPESLEEPKEMIVDLEVYGPQEAEVSDALMMDLATEYAKCNEYAEARGIIASVSSEKMQRLAFTELGKLCASAEHHHAIFEIEQDLGTAYDKALYWLAIHDATGSHNPELSQKALAKAQSSAEGIEHPVEKADALTEIALRFAKNQRIGQGEEFFLAATTTVTQMEGSFLQARALLRLAKVSQETSRKPNQDEQRLLAQII